MACTVAQPSFFRLMSALDDLRWLNGPVPNALPPAEAFDGSTPLLIALREPGAPVVAGRALRHSLLSTGKAEERSAHLLQLFTLDVEDNAAGGVPCDDERLNVPALRTAEAAHALFARDAVVEAASSTCGPPLTRLLQPAHGLRSDVAALFGPAHLSLTPRHVVLPPALIQPGGQGWEGGGVGPESLDGAGEEGEGDILDTARLRSLFGSAAAGLLVGAGSSSASEHPPTSQAVAVDRGGEAVDSLVGDLGVSTLEGVPCPTCGTGHTPHVPLVATTLQPTATLHASPRGAHEAVLRLLAARETTEGRQGRTGEGVGTHVQESSSACLARRQGAAPPGERDLVECALAAATGLPSTAFAVPGGAHAAREGEGGQSEVGEVDAVSFLPDCLHTLSVPASRHASAARICTDAACIGTLFLSLEAHAAALSSTTAGPSGGRAGDARHAAMAARVDALVNGSVGVWLVSVGRRYTAALLAARREAGAARREGGHISLLQLNAFLSPWLAALEGVAKLCSLLQEEAVEQSRPALGEGLPLVGVALAQRCYEAYVREQAAAVCIPRKAAQRMELSVRPPPKLQLYWEALSAVCKPLLAYVSAALATGMGPGETASTTRGADPHLPHFLASLRVDQAGEYTADGQSGHTHHDGAVALGGLHVSAALRRESHHLHLLAQAVPSLLLAVNAGGAHPFILRLPSNGTEAYQHSHSLSVALGSVTASVLRWAACAPGVTGRQLSALRAALPTHTPPALPLHMRDYLGSDVEEPAHSDSVGRGWGGGPWLDGIGKGERGAAPSLSRRSSAASAPSTLASSMGYTQQLGAHSTSVLAKERRQRATAEVKEVRAAAQRAELEEKLQRGAAKRAELARLEEQAAADRVRRDDKRLAEKEAEAKYAASLREADARGSSPLKGTASDKLYAEARGVLLARFGAQLASIGGMMPPTDDASLASAAVPSAHSGAVTLALDALASLGPRESAQAHNIARDMGLEWRAHVQQDAAPGDAPASRALEDDDGALGGGGGPPRAYPPRPSINLFAVLPELQALLPADAVKAVIRVTQAETGGHDSVRSMFAAGDGAASTEGFRPGVRVSSPPGGKQRAAVVGTAGLAAEDDLNGGTGGYRASSRVLQPPGGLQPGGGPTARSVLFGDGSDEVAGPAHVRVTQPAGGHSVMHSLLYGTGGTPEAEARGSAADSVRSRTGDSMLQVLQPGASSSDGEALVESGAGGGKGQAGPGLSSPGAKAALDHTEGGQAPVPLRTSATVPQSGGGYSASVALALEHSNVTTADVQTGGVAASSERTSVLVSQPAGGTSTVQTLLYSGGQRVDAEVGAARRKLHADTTGAAMAALLGGGPGELDAVQHANLIDTAGGADDSGRQTGAASTCTMDGASSLRTEVRLPSLKPKEGSVDGSAVARLLAHDKSAEPSSGVAPAASAEDDLRVLGRALHTHATTPVPALPREAALRGADTDEDGGELARTAAFTPAFAVRPALCGAALESAALGLIGATSITSSLLEAVGRAGGVHDTVSGSSRAGVGPTSGQDLSEIPLDAMLPLWFTSPLSRRLAQIEAATVAAVVLHAGLTRHYTALRGWMLLGCGQVMADFLATLRASTVRHTGLSAGVMDPSTASVLANNALNTAQGDAGVSHAFVTYTSVVRERVQHELESAVGQGAGGGTASDAARRLPSERMQRLLMACACEGDGRRSDGEEGGTTTGHVRAVDPTVQFLHCFSYKPSESGVSPRQELRHVVDLITPTYDPTLSPLDYEYTLSTSLMRRTLGDKRAQGGGETAHPNHTPRCTDDGLLSTVLTPASMSRYAALHSFLLRLRWAGLELRDAWVALMAVKNLHTPHVKGWASNSAEDAASGLAVPLPVYLFRHEAAHVLGCLEGYVSHTTIEAAYQHLLQDTAEALRVGSVRALRGAHDRYTARLVARARLGGEGEVGGTALGSRLIRSLLDTIQELCALIQAAAAGVAAARPSRRAGARGGEPHQLFDAPTLARVSALHAHFTGQLRTLKAALRVATLPSNATGPVQDLIVRLG